MKTIFYNIAGHTVAIETPDTAATVSVLPNFEPFRIDNPDESKNRLFTLTGNTLLAESDKTQEDDFDWNGIHYTVYNTSDGKLVTMTFKGKAQTLCTAHDWKYLRTDMHLTEQHEAQFLNNFLIVAFGMATAPLHTLKVHASVIEKGGKALLFLGRSGTGKSTHSRLWREFVPDCSLLNDDEPIVRIDDNGDVWVYGSPWSGKTPCYRNEKARVAAFVQLYQSPENRLSVLPAREAFVSLFGSCCMMRTDINNKNQIFNTVADVLERIPVYRLDCRPDREAVSLTETLI